MNTANENGNGEVPSHGEAFVALEKELRWFEIKKECNSTQLPMLKELYDLAVKMIQDA